MSAIRVVASCGCEYVAVCEAGWSLRAPPHCGWGYGHAYLKATGGLRPEHIPVIAAGYAMAARDGRGPWAPHWPGRKQRGRRT